MFIRRYRNNVRGAIVITGNTLGLSGNPFNSDPGTEDAINQFITTNALLPVDFDWRDVVNRDNNENITFDWRLNSSSANLSMQPGFTVLYAELIWGGLAVSESRNNQTAVSVTSFINNPISFTTPTGSISIAPDPLTSQEAVVPNAGTFYVRTQNVTQYVTQDGRYTVGGVASALNNNKATTINHAGWSLIVAYQNNAMPPRDLNIFVCEERIAANQPDRDLTITDFLTPPFTSINARISVSAQEGDANLRGDQMFFGPDAARLVTLSGPNNPDDNFFCSQINIGDPTSTNVGRINTLGTFGNRNHNASNGVMFTAGRQGWDITNVDGSDSITPNQSSALVRLSTNGDTYVLNGLGVQIDTILVTGTKTVNRSTASLNDEITYTVDLKNEGGAPQLITFIDPPPTGTSFVPGSLTVGNLPNAGNLTTGIPITIPANSMIQVVWRVRVGTTLPAVNPILNSGIIRINRLPDRTTNQVSTRILNADIGVEKTADTKTFVPGELASYTITVTNYGPDASQNVFINDDFHNLFINPQFRRLPNTTWESWPESNQYGVGTLANGESVTLIVRGLISSQATGTVVNNVSITSSTPDPIPINDKDRTETLLVPRDGLVLTKTTASTFVYAGNFIQYTVSVKNNGPSISRNVTLNDAFIPTADIVQYSLNNGGLWQDYSNPYLIGTLGVGQTYTLLIRAKVPAGATVPGNFINSASVTSTSTTTPVPVTVTTPIQALADLAITKTQNLNNPVVGDTLIYHLTLTNLGPSDAPNVLVEDAISNMLNPTTVVYRIEVGATLPWTGSYIHPLIQAGQSVNLYISGEVALDGIISNTAEISSLIKDPDLSNNKATVSTDQTDAELQISKAIVTSLPLLAGNEIEYRITYANTSNVTAYNVMITDPLPDVIIDPFYYVAATDTWLQWNGSLIVNELAGPSLDQVLRIRGTLLPDASGPITNTSTIIADNATQQQASATGEIEGEADIYVTKVADSTNVVAGEHLLFIMNVGNNGPSTAQSVNLTDIMPDGITNILISINNGAYVPWLAPYELDLNDLPPNGNPIFIRVTGTVAPSVTQNLLNEVVVTTTTNDPNQVNNQDSVLVNINTVADLNVIKTATPNPVVAGELITYQITVTNEGISDAQHVQITDELTGILLETQYSYTGTGNWLDWGGIHVIETLPSLASVTIYIRGRVPSSATGTIHNLVVVTSDTLDPNEEDNEDETDTPVIPSADLSIDKIVITDPVVAGKQIMYHLIVRNLGPSDATGINVTDSLPGNIKNQQYSLDNGDNWNDWESTLAIDPMAAGDVVHIFLRGDLTSISTETLYNRSTVDALTPDPNLDNNSDYVNVDINSIADLAIKKYVNPSPATLGEFITFYFTIVNYGPSNASRAELIDNVAQYLLDPQLSFDGGVSWQPWNGTFEFTTITPGAFIHGMIRGILDETFTESSITNIVRIGSDTTDPRPENNHDSQLTNIGQTTGTVDVSITKTTSTPVVSIGNQVLYTLTVNNAGPSIAENVTVTDDLTDLFTNVYYKLQNSSTWRSWEGSLELGSLASGQPVVIEIKADSIGNTSGFVMNTAYVSTTTPETNYNNNQSVAVVRLLENTQVTIKHCVYPNVINSCGIVNMKLKIRNTGNYIAKNVFLTNSFSQNISDIRVCVNGNVCSLVQEKAYIGDIAVGAWIEIEICARVCCFTCGFVYHTVNLESDSIPVGTATSTAVFEVR